MLVVFPFRGAELGGSHVATFTLARALHDQGGAECLILCAEGTKIAEEAKKTGLRVAASGEAPTGKNDFVTDITWRNWRRAVLEREIRGRDSVVHCNDVNTLRSWGLAARSAGLGVVYHHHALNRMAWPPHLVSMAYPHAVIAVSDATLQAMRRWRSDAIKELNTFDLDTGYDRKAARNAVLQEFGWPEDALVVGWVGNFWERKRPGFFLNVAAELKRLDPRYRFVMFGRDGDYSAGQIRQMSDKFGVGKETALPGFRLPVEANVACLDLLLAPAPREPFGRALVEAIVLGTPVVATRGAGHTEIIGAWGGGQLANADDSAEHVAHMCRETLAHADRYRLSPQRREQIAVELSPEAYAVRMLRLYDGIARRARERPVATPAKPLPIN